MRHAKVDLPKDKKVIEKLFNEALLNAYQFHTDELDCKKSFSRQRVGKSFNEVLEVCLNDKSSHWTILFRDKLIESDFAHYEFGVNSYTESNQFIWIKVNVDLSEKIFKKYGLLINWY